MASLSGGLAGTTGSAEIFVPEIWDPLIAEARDAAVVVATRVERHDRSIMAKGDILHIPSTSLLTATAVGASGTITASAPVETEVTINIDRYMHQAVRIPDQVVAQAGYNLTEIYTKEIGKSLARIVEDDLLGLESSVSSGQVLTAQADLDEDMFLNAIRLLDNANAPLDDRFLIVAPRGKMGLLLRDNVIRADARGKSAESTALNNGKVTDLFGVEVAVSSRVVTRSSTRRHVMFHRSAWVLAMQKKVSSEKLARTDLATTIVGWELYGYGEQRDSHVVVLPTNNT